MWTLKVDLDSPWILIEEITTKIPEFFNKSRQDDSLEISAYPNENKEDINYSLIVKIGLSQLRSSTTKISADYLGDVVMHINDAMVAIFNGPYAGNRESASYMRILFDILERDSNSSLVSHSESFESCFTSLCDLSKSDKNIKYLSLILGCTSDVANFRYVASEYMDVPYAIDLVTDSLIRIFTSKGSFIFFLYLLLLSCMSYYLIYSNSDFIDLGCVWKTAKHWRILVECEKIKKGSRFEELKKVFLFFIFCLCPCSCFFFIHSEFRIHARRC
jgi:hypothetical protein